MRCPALHRIIEDCNFIVPWCSIFLWSSSLFVYTTDSCAELQFSNTQVFGQTLSAENGTQVQIPFSVIRKRCNKSDDMRITVSRWSNTTSAYFPLCNIIQKQNICRNSTSGNMTSNETIACVCLGTDGEYLVTMTVTEQDFTKWQWSIDEMSDTIIWITKSGARLQFNNTQVFNNTLTSDAGTQVDIPFSVKYMTRNKSDDLQITVSRWNNMTSVYFPLCNIIQKQNACRNSTSVDMTSNETIACVCLGTDGEYLVTMTVTEQDFTKWQWSIKGESDTIIWITKSDPTNEVATPKVITTSNQALQGTIGILVGVFTAITVLAILVALSKKIVGTLLEVPYTMPKGDLDIKATPALFTPQNEDLEDTTSQAFIEERRQDVNAIVIHSVRAFAPCVVDKAENSVYGESQEPQDRTIKESPHEGRVNKDGLIYTTLDLADIQSKDTSTFSNLRPTIYAVLKSVNDTFSNDNEQIKHKL